MKTLQLPTFLLVILLTGCLTDKYDDEPFEYSKCGIYHKSQNIIITDENETLFINNPSKVDLKNNSRVWVFFTIDEIVKDSPIKISVKEIYDIFTPLILINEDNKDSLLRNAPIFELYSIWIAHDYLNFNFCYRKNTTQIKVKKHYFFVSKNEEERDDGKILLKFHHNANNDEPPYEKLKNIISIPISELKNAYPEKDAIELIISIPCESGNLEHNILYKKTGI